jgi:hypothetical protein
MFKNIKKKFGANGKDKDGAESDDAAPASTGPQAPASADDKKKAARKKGDEEPAAPTMPADDVSTRWHGLWPPLAAAAALTGRRSAVGLSCRSTQRMRTSSNPFLVCRCGGGGAAACVPPRRAQLTRARSPWRHARAASDAERASVAAHPQAAAVLRRV